MVGIIVSVGAYHADYGSKPDLHQCLERGQLGLRSFKWRKPCHTKAVYAAASARTGRDRFESLAA